MSTPLRAYYKGGQYVLVHDEQAQEGLRLLGCFGTNLEDAKRKETKRGPGDRQLVDFLELEEVNHPLTKVELKQTTALTLHEAFFLAYSFGCLSIEQPSHVESEQHQQLSLRMCWNIFREYHKNSNISVDFALEYGVYHYFRTRHWIVKAGTNYGTNFILYKDGPSQGHSQYAVIIVDEASGYNWTSFLTFHRVCQSVGKELLLTFVSVEQNTDLNEPHCVRKMKILTKIFTAQARTIGRQNSETNQEQSTNKLK